MRWNIEGLMHEVLECPTRKRIYTHLLQNPGDHYRSVMRAVNIGNGNLSYHLHRMQKANVIRIRRGSGRTRLYPMEAIPGEIVSDLMASIVSLVAERPGSTDQEIAFKLDRSIRWIRKNLNELEDRSMIGVARDRCSWKCYLLGPEPRDASPAPPGMVHSPASI